MKITGGYGELLERKLRGDGFKTLGCQVQFNNRFEKELLAREVRAWRAYSVIKEVVECGAVLDKQRYALFRATVERSFFWCAGSWNLTQKNLQMVRALQLRFLRRMFYVKKKDEETTDEYMARSTGDVIRRLRAVNGRKWDEEVHLACYGWSGFLARLCTKEPTRLTSKILVYRNYEWLRQREALNKGRQCHQRYIRAWRFEHQLQKYVGPDWRQQAQNLQSWTLAGARFMLRRCGR